MSGNNQEEISVRWLDAALCNICQKSALFAKSSIVLRRFWVKLHKKCPFLKILDTALKFWIKLRMWKREETIRLNLEE